MWISVSDNKPTRQLSERNNAELELTTQLETDICMIV